MFRVGSALIGGVVLALAIGGSTSAQPAADPYGQIAQYKFGQPRTALMTIEAEIHAAQPEQLRIIESKLLAILPAPGTSADGKDWICRQLRQAGSEQSVPALAALLTDKDLATVARMALQSIPGGKVDEALRRALARVDGEQKAGVLHTLGSRGDRQAVALAAPLVGDPDPVVAEAALFALGHIGGAEALRALQDATVPASLHRYRFHAMLLCAERMAAAGQMAEAATVYQSIYKQTDDRVIKTAALRGVLVADPAGAAPLLTAALKSEQPRLRSAAAKFVSELGRGELLRTVLADLSALPADSAVTLLSLVGDPAALPAVLQAAGSSEADVRLAALTALGRVGDATTIKLLLSVAQTEQGEPQAAVRRSLQDLRDPAVDPALIAAAQQGEAAIRAEAIRALAARSAVTAVPLLLKAAADAEPTIQAEAFTALGVLADLPALPALVQLLVEAKSDGQRGAAEKALVAACRRIDDKAAAAAPVLAALPSTSPPVRAILLAVLARVPAANSLAALRAAVNDPDAAVQDTAIRGLAEWPDAPATADLLAIARTAKTPVHKVLALRGVIRLASLPNAGPADQVVKLLAEALALASRAEEKKLVLGALAEVNHAAALDLATGCLTDKELEVEAATTVVKIAKRVQRTKPDVAAAAIKKILDTCQAPAARQVAEGAMIIVANMVNIAPQGTATSPDGLEKDGGASGDQAAIDGNPDTYWDEEDKQKLYRLVVTFKQPEKIGAISILGYAHHSFAPKDFELLGDGKVVKKVENAQYDDNFLVVRLDETVCTTVELKITGYYGGSPAIRELGIYRPAAK